MMFAYMFELVAYGCFLMSLFGSTCAYMDHKRKSFWDVNAIMDLLLVLKTLLICGAIFHSTALIFTVL
jgi:hypothetical protein